MRARIRIGAVSRNRLDGLQVLVVGVEALISREVVRELAAEGAWVTAAASDRAALTRLERDLGLYRTSVALAPIDLASGAELGHFAESLQLQDRMPHLVVCCCAGTDCPCSLAASLLQPSLILHVLPRAASRLDRAVARLNIPSLPALLQRARCGGLFDPGAGPQCARVAGRLFSFRRGERPLSRAPARRARQRAESPTRPAPRRESRQETS